MLNDFLDIAIFVIIFIIILNATILFNYSLL
jgi:hypothetical protein